MFEKIKKIIKKDLQKRYDQLEERFLVFEQKLYGHLADRLDSLEHQLDQLSEILRQKAGQMEAPPTKEKEEKVSKKIKNVSPKKTFSKKIVKNDDLKKLPGLGNILEKKLHAEGIKSYEQLAKINESDLEKLNSIIPGLKVRYDRYEWKKEAEKRL